MGLPVAVVGALVGYPSVVRVATSPPHRGTPPCLFSLLVVAGAFLGSLPWGSFALRPPSDIILQARCSLICTKINNQCIKDCMAKGWRDKIGGCPMEDARPHTLACIDECHNDSQCHGMDKCCPHKCGVTCKPPTGLEIIKGLPEVPKEIKIEERKKSGVVVISWGAVGAEGEGVVYIVEERHVAGFYWQPQRLSPWATAHRAPKHSNRAKINLRPGSWYQIRVAAVNINGTKGFSPPSHQFKLSTLPKGPQPPVDLMFSHMSSRNNSICGLLSWEPPYHSDLPLLRYNVAWIRRLPSDHKQFTNTKRVNSDKTSLKIKNLVPDSTYDFLVEAVSQYGKEKLVSSKATLQLNTSSSFYSNKRSPGNRNERLRQKQMQVQVSKPRVSDNKLSVVISWKSTRPPKPYEKFALSWESTDCGSKVSKNVITKETHYELTGLSFACKYSLFVRDKQLFGRKSRRVARISLNTPPCTAFNPQPC